MNETNSPSKPSTRTLRGLDWLNFFLADVQSGVGPFLAVYLVGVGWNEEQVGFALMAGGLAGIAAQTPAGALVDRLHSKRTLIAIGIVTMALTGVAIAAFPSFWPVIACEIVIGFGASVFVPAVCALSLGLVGARAFDRRQGRNQAFNSAGNVFAAIAMGLIGYVMSNRNIFYFVGALAIPALAALAAIRPEEIDYARARGAKNPAQSDDADPAASPSLRVRHTLGVFLVCAALFHFANAAMLSLVGEMLVKARGRESMMYMSACVIVTQFIIAATASSISRAAGHWGRRPALLAAFAALTLRGVLYITTQRPAGLVMIQVFDGLASSLFGVVSILVIADLTRGSGRFNLTVGVFSTVIGIGAASSQLVAGTIAHRLGYHASFLFLSGVAAVALGVLALAMPETRRS